MWVSYGSGSAIENATIVKGYGFGDCEGGGDGDGDGIFFPFFLFTLESTSRWQGEARQAWEGGNGGGIRVKEKRSRDGDGQISDCGFVGKGDGGRLGVSLHPCLMDVGGGLGEGVQVGEDRAIEEGEVGEGGEHRRDGSAKGIAGEVDVGEVPEVTKGFRDVAMREFPMRESTERPAMLPREKGMTPESMMEWRSRTVREGGRQVLNQSGKGPERRKSSSLHQRSEEGVVALVDGDAEEEGGGGVLIDMEASSGRTEDLGCWERCG